MKSPDFHRSCDIVDLLDSENSEGRILWQLFQHHGVRGLYRYGGGFPSVDALFDNLTASVSARNRAAREANEPLYEPQLHIACHGCDAGIAWVDGSIISWSKLKALLLRFAAGIGHLIGPEQNGAFAQRLGLLSLSLSCCNGSSAARHFFDSEPYPVIAFITPRDQIWNNDCAEFFLRLYSATLSEPWNIQQTVSRLLQERMPMGPAGPVPIECHVPHYSPNENWRPKQEG